MPERPLHAHEADRLTSLHSYRVLDTPPDAAVDAVTAAVAKALDAPMALVTLLDDRRQWFKSRVGVDLTETGRELSFCRHVVAEERPMVVADATQDPRFARNELVTGDFHLRFYAGAPLIGRDGLPLGALCVLDTQPRTASPREIAVLEALARTVVELLELRRLEADSGLTGRDVLEESRRLRQGIDDGELVVEYQPIVTLPTRRIMGVEALVRWEHPGLGRLAPGLFLPVAEASGLMVPLGRLVLTQACRQLRAWRDGLGPESRLELAVNMSGRQLTDPDVVHTVLAVLAETGLSPRALTLELTETATVDADPAIDAALAELRAAGVLLALDDFGTGYSSLQHLQRFQPDVVKLDRGFVQHLERSQRDEVIARSCVQLASQLGCPVVAEGIETPGQLQAAVNMGCSFGQGYLFSPPCSADDMTALLVADFAVPAVVPATHSVGNDAGGPSPESRPRSR